MHNHPFRLRKTLLATFVAAIAHGTAFAEDAAIPTISVTAAPIVDNTDYNSTSVDNATLESLKPATSDTASLLKNVPGMTIQTGGGVSGLPVLHGLGDDRLRIKVDGMDLISACGNHMNPPLSYIDPSNVSSATVFAGISPVSIGGDSIGGTILVDSTAPGFANPGEGSLFTGEAGFFVRSNGNAHGDHVTATAASETFSMTFTSATTQADDYTAGDDFKDSGPAAAGREWLDGDEVGSSMYKSTNRSLTLAHRSENHLTELKLGQQDIPYQGWVNQRMDMTGNDSTQINLRHKAELDWGTLEARAYREHTYHSMQFYDDKLFWYGSQDGTTFPDGEPCTITSGMNGCAAGMPMDTEGNNVGGVIKADLPLSDRDLVRAGIEVQKYTLDDWWEPSGKGMWPNTFININNGQRDRLALYTEWEATWNAHWLTLLGVRGEKVTMNADEVQGYNPSFTPVDAADFNSADREKTDNNLDLTALARITPSATQTLEFGLAQKTRSPNLYERYTWSTQGMAMRMINMAGDGNGYVGNLDLEPEVAHTISASYSWHAADQKKWELKVSPYYTRVKDYIDAERCSSASTNQTSGTACTDANLTVEDNFVYLQFVNQEATIYGMDISGHYPLVEGSDYGNLTMQGVLSYTRGKNDTTDDNLYNIMPLNMKLALVQQKGGWSNTAEVVFVDAKKDVSATRNEVETDGYSLLNLRSSYTWKQVRFDVGVDNVFDKFYNDPLGGAYMGQGKTMSSGDVAWGTPVPGMGRNVYAGVNINF